MSINKITANNPVYNTTICEKNQPLFYRISVMSVEADNMGKHVYYCIYVSFNNKTSSGRKQTTDEVFMIK